MLITADKHPSTKSDDDRSAMKKEVSASRARQANDAAAAARGSWLTRPERNMYFAHLAIPSKVPRPLATRRVLRLLHQPTDLSLTPHPSPRLSTDRLARATPELLTPPSLSSQASVDCDLWSTSESHVCPMPNVALSTCASSSPPPAAPTDPFDFATSRHRSGFDNNRVYSVSVLPGADRERDLSKAQAHLFEFLQTFRVGGEFKYRCVVRTRFAIVPMASLNYSGRPCGPDCSTLTVESTLLNLCRDRIRSSLLARQHVVEIDLRDLIVYNEDLAQSIQEKPGDFVPMVRSSP